MCGFCGFIQKKEFSFPRKELLSSMCRTIVHRGPDDQGIHLNKNVGLGACRLSIIDVEGGHQPLSNETGTIWIAYNGEVYNFPTLKEELLEKGHKFSTKSDTETIIHAYEEWGENFIHRLRGMFAFAIWDGEKNILLLYRDRLGIKPLYYTLLEGGTLVFGSELKCLLKHPDIPRRLEPRALDFFLSLEYIPAPYSAFQNIFKLPQGSYLKYRDGNIEVKKYWDVLPQSEKELIFSAEDNISSIMDKLFALLKESVSLRLISDVPLGAFLSGGIDSSCIVGLMRELGVSPLMTFSIGFEDSSYNELEHARRIAEKFQTEHEEFIIKPQALQLTEKLINHLDEPFGDFSIFPTYLVSQMARKKVKVILSGDGGDEIFAGYEHYQAQKISRWPFFQLLPKTLTKIIHWFPPSGQKKGLWNKTRRFLQGLSHEKSLRHLRWMMFLSKQDKQSLYTLQFQEQLSGIPLLYSNPPFQEYFQNMKNFDEITRELYLDLKSYLADDILVKVDRMSMAASLETRVPLLDHKLVEFAFSLPGKLKLHGLSTKWIFKKTMEPLLPKENIYRPKEGFSIPIKHWLRNELKEMLLDYLSPERLRKEGLFNPHFINWMISRHLAGRENFSHQLWALMVFEIWKENYL